MDEEETGLVDEIIESIPAFSNESISRLKKFILSEDIKRNTKK